MGDQSVEDFSSLESDTTISYCDQTQLDSFFFNETSFEKFILKEIQLDVNKRVKTSPKLKVKHLQQQQQQQQKSHLRRSGRMRG